MTDSTFVIQGFLRELRCTVGRLSERINTLGRDGGPLSGGDADAVSLPGRLIRQMEKLSLGDSSSRGVDLSRPPRFSKRLSISQKFAAADCWPKFLPVLAILHGGFALGFAATYYWAFIIAMLLGGD